MYGLRYPGCYRPELLPGYFLLNPATVLEDTITINSYIHMHVLGQGKRNRVNSIGKCTSLGTSRTMMDFSGSERMVTDPQLERNPPGYILILQNRKTCPQPLGFVEVELAGHYS